MPQTVTTSPDVLFQELTDQTVLLDLTTGTYFALDPVGSVFWKQLADHGDTSKTIEAVLNSFAVDRDQVVDDFCELIDQLDAEGLIAAS
nr:PqqD family protein [Gymnodinialimonas phycosphaerae]